MRIRLTLEISGRRRRDVEPPPASAPEDREYVPSAHVELAEPPQHIGFAVLPPQPHPDAPDDDERRRGRERR